jgi:NADP-dependent 3-hydroxy acid dehydrogenase YdfG
MTRDLRGKTAVITGASSGIGEAAAREFARAGVKVVLAARRVERLERLAREIRSQGGEALPIPTDLTDQAQITRLVLSTLEAYGRIDILANIAGWGRYDWLEEMQPHDLRQQYEVNVIGLAELTRQVIPVMQRQRSGHIINMSSYASKVAVPPLTVYASTKYAVEGLSDALRRELRPWGIHVSRVHPSGVTGTEFNRKAGQAGGIRFKSVPIGRVTREEVARAMVRLARRPRRAIFLSRLYDLPAFVNYRAPGVVDLASALWVRWKRREEVGLKPDPVELRRLALPAVLLSLAGALIGARAVRRRR